MHADGYDGILEAISSRNFILSHLPPLVLDKLAPHLQHLDLPQGTVLVHSEEATHWVYFVERGMASVDSADLSGTPVEVGIIGREGIVGVHALLGQPRTRNSVVMQGAGEGYRVRAELLRDLLPLHGALLAMFHTFLYALLEQTTQLVLCNRLHELESRLARWLLMASDFMETRTLRLTQEFLSEMLGVGRPAVSIAAGILQRRGLIVYSRGQIEIRDREQLEKVACECYGVIRQAYHRVYPDLY